MVRLRDSWPFSLSSAPAVGNPCRPLQPESVSDTPTEPTMTYHFDAASFVSQAEANGYEFGTNANFLTSLEAGISLDFARAKGASRETLEALRGVGEKLNEAKETL